MSLILDRLRHMSQAYAVEAAHAGAQTREAIPQRP